MAIRILARRVAKVCYFVMIIIGLGHLLPAPESYIDYDFAMMICDYLYGSVNADSMYDVFSDIDLIIILAITTTIYKATIMLINKTRRK